MYFLKTVSLSLNQQLSSDFYLFKIYINVTNVFLIYFLHCCLCFKSQFYNNQFQIILYK